MSSPRTRSAAALLGALALTGCHLVVGHSRSSDASLSELGPRELGPLEAGSMDARDAVAPDLRIGEPIRVCEDGTPLGACSARVPLRCSEKLGLAQNCSACGCPSSSLCGPGGRCEGTLVAPAVADAAVKESKPTINFGAETSLRIGRDGMGLSDEVLINFDLESIPPQALVESAVLTLEVISWPGTPVAIEIRILGAPWDEKQVSWSNAPAGLPTLLATTALVWSQNQVDLKAVIQAWLTSGYVRYGLRLRPASTDKNGIQFASREHGTASFHPKLTVLYR